VITSTPFSYERPHSLAQALNLLQSREQAVLLAGGTDLVPLLKLGLKRPHLVIALDRIEYLSRIEEREEGLFIGAMTRLRVIAESKQVQAHCCSLADSARRVASPQIRTVGTIGGNLCQDRRCIFFNQSPFWRQSLAPCFKTGGRICHQKPSSSICRAIYYSDLAPVLMSLGARVELFGKAGLVELPAAEFIHDHVTRNGGIQPGKALISGFIIPRPTRDAWLAFAKHSVRSAIDFPMVNGAICYLPGGDLKTPHRVSVVVGAAGPEPIELVETRALIVSQPAHGEEQKQEWVHQALSELNEKCELIQDTGLSIKARKKAFGVVGMIVGQLHDFISDSPSVQRNRGNQ